MKKQIPISGTYITQREFQVLQLLCNGYHNKQVANALFISIKTVEKHRGQLNKKLGVDCVIGLLRVSLRGNIISYPDWLNCKVGEALHLDSVSGQQIKLPSPLSACAE